MDDILSTKPTKSTETYTNVRDLLHILLKILEERKYLKEGEADQIFKSYKSDMDIGWILLEVMSKITPNAEGRSILHSLLIEVENRGYIKSGDADKIFNSKDVETDKMRFSVIGKIPSKHPGADTTYSKSKTDIRSLLANILNILEKNKYIKDSEVEETLRRGIYFLMKSKILDILCFNMKDSHPEDISTLEAISLELEKVGYIEKGKTNLMIKSETEYIKIRMELIRVVASINTENSDSSDSVRNSIPFGAALHYENAGPYYHNM